MVHKLLEITDPFEKLMSVTGHLEKCAWPYSYAVLHANSAVAQIP